MAGQHAPGRRETNKLATRKALEDAAERLFAERGTRETTVRDIAEAAGVTERTFFRYFASKEDLILPAAFAWMPALHATIRARPAGETPLRAVQQAVLQLLPALTRLDAASPLALFAEGPLVHRVGSAVMAMLVKLESDLADVLAERLVGDPGTAADHRFRAETVARASVAAFRSAMLYNSQLTRDGVTDRPDLHTLLERAFDAIME